MGYTTNFKGVLLFTKELNGKELKKVKSFLGEDCRQHEEWGRTDLSYIDLELTDDFSGLQWDGSEKTYDLQDKVNVIIDEMRKEFPDFGLEGHLVAQGEDVEDRWTLSIEANGRAVKRPVEVKGAKVKCPHCGEKFIVEE
jgi:hypothetical protein